MYIHDVHMSLVMRSERDTVQTCLASGLLTLAFSLLPPLSPHPLSRVITFCNRIDRATRRRIERIHLQPSRFVAAASRSLCELTNSFVIRESTRREQCASPSAPPSVVVTSTIRSYHNRACSLIKFTSARIVLSGNGRYDDVRQVR